MIIQKDLDQLVCQIRLSFVLREISPKLLEEIYREYNPILNIEKFIQKSQNLFPHLNCGIASVYLKHILKRGEIKQGFYGKHAHTVLWLNEEIIDITADQFGGPCIYRGPLRYPWSIEKS